MTPPSVPPGGDIPSGWKCPRRVGFLFPHECRRLTPVGCKDCDGGDVADPYIRRSRYGYSQYDYYDDSITFLAIDSMSHHHNWESSSPQQFTEADGESLVTPQDDTFEDDMSGS